jgi:hypothetical protein
VVIGLQAQADASKNSFIVIQNFVNVPSSALPPQYSASLSSLLYTERGYSENLYSPGNTSLNKSHIFDIGAAKCTIRLIHLNSYDIASIITLLENKKQRNLAISARLKSRSQGL